jgi:dTDP-L-rhamnose 4-epimerase
MILVTGGAGFIGSHIVEALVRDGYEVRVLDWLHGSNDAARPDCLPPDAELVIGDVRDRQLVEECLVGVTQVCHQAAMVGMGVDMSDLTAFASHNDLGTATLVQAMAERRFTGRLVLASSMVVYGEGAYSCPRHGAVSPSRRESRDLAAGLFEPRCPSCSQPLSPSTVTEQAPLSPTSVYAATKVHQEHLCEAFARATGVTVTALRYHNVYGPRMPRDTPYAGVAAIFASAVGRGEAPRVFEDGRQLRDFVHVRDVARANVLALTTPEPVPGPLNIASGTPRTVGEMAAAIAGAGDRSPALLPVVTAQWRAGDVRHIVASPERAKQELGFKAREDFGRGMAEVAARIRATDGVRRAA